MTDSDRLRHLARAVCQGEWGIWESVSEGGMEWQRPPYKPGNYWGRLIESARSILEELDREENAGSN